jgi:hypothetical protein
MRGNSRFSGIILTGLLVLAIASGCVQIATMYNGHPVNQVPIVTLEDGGPNAGRWQTFDLSIDYKYTLQNGNLDISGKITPSDFYQMNYSMFWSLDVYVFAVDQASRVVETSRVLALGGVGTGQSFDFSQQFKLPAGTTGLSFGYDGVAKDQHDTMSFFKLPIDK